MTNSASTKRKKSRDDQNQVPQQAPDSELSIVDNSEAGTGVPATTNSGEGGDVFGKNAESVG